MAMEEYCRPKLKKPCAWVFSLGIITIAAIREEVRTADFDNESMKKNYIFNSHSCEWAILLAPRLFLLQFQIDPRKEKSPNGIKHIPRLKKIAWVNFNTSKSDCTISLLRLLNLNA